MTTLVVGASGETGRLLVEQLLNRDESLRVIACSGDNLPETIRSHPSLSTTQASITEMSDTDLAKLQCDGLLPGAYAELQRYLWTALPAGYRYSPSDMHCHTEQRRRTTR